MTDSVKAFISYSWGSREHQQWVLNLASQLRESAVDVKLDKWDLREGHDTIKFMEQMVTDPEVKKVVIVLDREYVEKADGRKGGVGTETQIISPEIYQKADQNKFVCVLSERDDEGQPFLPAYYKSRIYIDLSSSDVYATNFEQLLRWIYDKPAHPKPPLGNRPTFLDEGAIALPTHSRAARAIELMRAASPNAKAALDEYLTSLTENLEAFRINEFDRQSFDEAIVQNVTSFLPYRDEYIGVISTLAKYATDTDSSVIHRFFERLIPYLSRPKNVMQYSDYYWDNFKFVIHELFLYTIAILLKEQRFDFVLQLMTEGYYVGDALADSHRPILEFSIFRQHMSSLKYRNERLKLNRASVRADLLDQRSHASGLSLRELMQADFLLFFFDSMMAAKEKRSRYWWPETLLYYHGYTGPFEIFARAQSQKYFDRIKPMLAVNNKTELGEALSLPSWGSHDNINPFEAMDFDKLASRP